jgi:hypothetical protein
MGNVLAYEDRTSLVSYLADQLTAGALTVVLGAGASFGFGLPSWDELVERLRARAGLTLAPRLSAEQAAEYVLVQGYGNDRIRFAEAVRLALYDGAKLSLAQLVENPLLSAVGTLAMASSRGSVSTIVSFNFDDVLELFLSQFGHDVESIDTMPAWNSRADLRVLHPHGWLPSDLSVPIERGVVFTQMDYDELVGDAKDAWRATMINLFSTHTCLFIGLSGNDNNITNILTEVNKIHVARRRGDLFWAVRFELETDPYLHLWAGRGVYNHIVADFAEIPAILFEVCQHAARERASARARLQ